MDRRAQGIDAARPRFSAVRHSHAWRASPLPMASIEVCLQFLFARAVFEEEGLRWGWGNGARFTDLKSDGIRSCAYGLCSKPEAAAHISCRPGSTEFLPLAAGLQRPTVGQNATHSLPPHSNPGTQNRPPQSLDVGTRRVRSREPPEAAISSSPLHAKRCTVCN